MEAKTNYTIVGALVVLLALGLIAAGLWLSIGFNQKKYNVYVIYLHESAAGLNEESIVKFNGVAVGFVKKIELNPVDPQQVEILLNIEDGTPITNSTFATLISQGITGNAYVGLSANSSDLTPLNKLPQDPYPIIPTKPSLLNQLDKALKDVSENINSVTKEVNRIFDKDNARYVKHLLANLEKFTGVLADNTQKINQTLTNSELLVKNAAKISQEFPAMAEDLKKGIEQFKVMSGSITVTSKKIAGAMDSSKITIDKISQQTLPQALSLLAKLNTIAANIAQVSNQMRQNPAIILRGVNPPKSGPGE